MAAERLQKILAAAGISSRRKAEELISGGHVSVNGHVITELGTKADSRLDEIRVDGQVVGRPERHVYFMLYKPKGCVTTMSDPEGRPTIKDLLADKGVRERLFPVGRLDYMSEGLLLLTNDGDLMAKLTHAKTHVPKTYMVKVSGHPTEEQIDKLREGITLPPEPGLAGARGKKQPGVERRSFAVKTQPAEIELTRDQENPWYQVTLIEGRNRQIRRMFEEIGYHIEKIKRIRYGTLELNVEPGEIRQLSFGEINDLKKAMTKPYRIQPPRPKVEGEAPARRMRPSKAAQRGFPKPERRGAKSTRDDKRPRPAAKLGVPAASADPQPREMRPPSPDGFRARPDFKSVDRKKSFGPGKPAKKFEGAEDSRGERVSAPPRRSAPFKKTDGAFGREGRAGGFKKREGSFTPREGGFKKREGGYKPRDGGFKPREGSFQKRESRPFSPRGDRPTGPRSDRPSSGPRSDRPRSDRPFTPRGDRPAGPRSDRPRSDRPSSPRGDRPFTKRGPSSGPSRGPRSTGGSSTPPHGGGRSGGSDRPRGGYRGRG